MLGRLWQILTAYSDGDGCKDNWLKRHRNAQVTKWERLDKGYRIVAEENGERRVFITDELGNVKVVQP